MRTFLLLLVVASQLPAAITVKHANGDPDSPYTAAQLQTAIDATSTTCGDIIEIDAGGTRQGVSPYLLRGPALDPSLGGPSVAPAYSKDCSASGQYITIRSSRAYQLTPGKRVGADDAANLAFIGINATGSCIVMITSRAANYWRLQGLELAATPKDCGNSGGNHILRIVSPDTINGSSASAREDDYPNHIIIDQCWIHGIDGFAVADGVHLGGANLSLINSTVENIRTSRFNAKESHGIGSTDGGSAARIINNKVSAGMITVLWGGAVAPHQFNRMDWVEFLNNWLFRPFKWLDWAGTNNPTPLSPCPVDYDGHGATYQNTSAVTYWECQGAPPGTWTQLADVAAYNALVNARLPQANKNIFEIKDGSRMHLEGNLFDQTYSWTFQQQVGACFLFNMVIGGGNSGGANFSEMAAHVLIENNICQHAPRGIAQGSNFPTLPGGGSGDYSSFWGNGSRPTHDLVFKNNVFQHMGEDMYTQPAFGTLTNWAGTSFFASVGVPNRESITYDHDTWQSEYTWPTFPFNAGIKGDVAYVPSGLQTTPLGQRFLNNIWTAGRCGAARGDNTSCAANSLSQVWGPYLELATNAVVDNLGIGAGGMISLSQHCAPGSGPGCPYTTASTVFPPNCVGCQYPTPALAKFVSYPNDLTLQSDSPLIAAGLDGKNIGADLNTVGWATAGAQAGTMAPYLAMKIRGVVPSATSVDVRFSAIDTSSCTIDARVYGLPLSTPVATATDNTATLDRLVTLTGLSSGQKYALKVTCAGLYYREDEFLTP